MKRRRNCKELSEGADAGWAEAEFERVECGDGRLDRRLKRVAEELSGQPEYPINLASQDAAATKAAYRLFDNEKVAPDRIIAAHRDKTLQRMREEPIVLAIQDTSFFNFTSHKKTRGLGPIGEKNSTLQGLIMHTVFAVTLRGLPLGVLWQRTWARSGFRESAEAHEELLVEEKESYRWIEALRDTGRLAASGASGTMVVTVADRESDIYEFLLEGQRLNVKYLIRASHDRCVCSEEHRYLQEMLKAAKPQGRIKVEIPSQKRKATLEVTFLPVKFKPPGRIRTSSQNRVPASCWVINAVEKRTKRDIEPICWTLLTNIPVTSIEQAIERISWYRRRWSIEEFHKIIKSGCAVEKCRLESAKRLQRYIALFCVIAWRLFWMVHIRRADPNAPAEVVLVKTEIGALCSLKRFNEVLPPAKKLTVRQAVTAIACLGGYLNRKNDPPPGPIVLWRGWQRLASMAELYESMTGYG